MIDTVDRLLKSTLDALCPNVARLFFRGKAGTYITYQLVSSEDMAAADVRAKVGPDMIIGVSAHSVEEAQLAVAHGADYLGVGAAFSTHTKTDVDVLPEGRLKEICDSVDVPVVAIGGIHKDNILKLKGSGADGVALVSAIFSAEDIEAECKELKALTEQIIYSNSTF